MNKVPEHSCGVEGFNEQLGDYCPGCNYIRRQLERDNQKIERLLAQTAVDLPPQDFTPQQPADPKALTAGKKLPLLSVMSPASMIHEAVALQYGAFDAPKVDGTFGYGPYNWRCSEPVECMTYVDAAVRHIFKYLDGEEYDPDTGGRAHHLGLAKASLGILLDALENDNLIDNRPRVRKQVASRLLDKLKKV